MNLDKLLKRNTEMKKFNLIRFTIIDKLNKFKKDPFNYLKGGFRDNLYIYYLRFLSKIQDFVRGVDTEEIIELPSLGIEPSFGSRYETTSYNTLKLLLKFARKKGFISIVDIGCGYGRPLIVAKEVGFLNFYGVDISEKLINRCNSNLQKLKIKAQLTCCDAVDYKIPKMDLVIFLFNPVNEERVGSIVRELLARKEKYLIIYQNPKYINCFPSSPIYIHLNRHFGLYREMAYIYEV